MLTAAPDPADAFERLRGQGTPWLLESALTLPGAARYSFVGADPYLVLRANGTAVELECHRVVYPGLRPGVVRAQASITETLRALMPTPPDEGSPLPFTGGAVGALGYEAAEQFDVHRLSGVDDLGLPDAVWLFVDAVLGIDHDRETAFVVGLGFDDDPQTARAAAECAADALHARLTEPVGPAPSPALHATRFAESTWSKLEPAAYLKAIDEIAEEIAAGEIYQACLT
jgi:anthranilate/para-aminobenzoate synthase component I